MAVRLSAQAREQIEDIWLYTEEHWGEAQANAYVEGLFELFERLAGARHLWQPVLRASLSGAFHTRYRSHMVFFRALSDGDVGILAVLHQRQDIPRRLQDIDEGFGD